MTDVERLPPQNLDAEKGVLGSILLANEYMDEVIGVIDEEQFYSDAHSKIFKAIREMRSSGHSGIDAVTLAEELDRRNHLEEVGGVDSLLDILRSVPHAAHALYYADLVRQHWVRRAVIYGSTEAIRRAYDATLDTEEILAEAQSNLFHLADKVTRDEYSSMSTVMIDVLKELSGGERDVGIPSGFPDLDKLIHGFRKGNMITIAARPSVGKAQPLSSRILMRDGRSKRMRDIRVGDEVASPDGSDSVVTGVYPQGLQECFEVTLSDGRSCLASGDHLWRVSFRGWESSRVLETNTIAQMIAKKRYAKRIWVDPISGQHGRSKDLFIHPYLMGILLSEGDLGGGSPRFTTADTEVRDSVSSILPRGYCLSKDESGDGITYRIVQEAGASQIGHFGSLPNKISQHLRKMELHGLRSHKKFIHPEYLSASFAQRVELLKGLMDGDGTVGKGNGAVQFCSTSRRLAEDVVYLTRSIGGSGSLSSKETTYSYRGETRRGRTAYICNLQHPQQKIFFKLERKRNLCRDRQRQRRLNIVSINPVGLMTCQCISVSSPSQMYVTDGFIPTHNTAFACNICCNLVNNGGRVLFFSLEQTRIEIAERFLSIESKIDGNKLKTGDVTESERQVLMDHANRIDRFPVWIPERRMTIDQIAAVCRKMQRKEDINCVVVDYLQLVKPHNSRVPREQQVSYVSQGLKDIAKEQSIPVIALAQLNRETDKATGQSKRPRLHNLRESGAIEQDSDLVLLLDRPGMNAVDIEDTVTKLYLDKQRNGATGEVSLTFLKDCMRFESAALYPSDPCGDAHLYDDQY